MTESNKVSKPKLAIAEYIATENPTRIVNPWNVKPSTVQDIDQDDYVEIVNKCRFYYRNDPLAATAINKLVEIGINDLRFSKNGLSDNEFRVFLGIKQELLAFAEEMALEFLISGLVVPEIKYIPKSKEDIKRLGLKKYDTFTLPEGFWLRDPCSIEINKTIVSSMPSYYVLIPDDLRYFINNKGKYPDGTRDDALYAWLTSNYPSFVIEVEKGATKVQLTDTSNIIRRRVLQDSPYPVPFLSPALDILEHKRNLRKADYSIATKVISAILQIKVGSDEFPMTEAEEDAQRLIDLKNALIWRNYSTNSVENIFQLFTDHTTELKWVFPDINLLLNDAKYKEVNQEIVFALGFPRTLIAGESERSNASDPEYASISPVKMMENFRNKILDVIKDVVYEICTRNSLKSIPSVTFKPINLYDFQTYLQALKMMLEAGSLSRESLDEIFGYTFEDELEKREAEQKALEESGVPEFQPTPNSRQPNIQNNTSPQKPKAKSEGEGDKEDE